VLEEWTAALADELGLDLEVDTTLLLDVAADAAHSVTRTAAPVTTFLVGYAAAQRGGSRDEIVRAAAAARDLAGRWSAG
jgi:Domain of unknown function (DUF6457)